MTTNVPASLVAGDDWSWVADYSDRPAPAHSITVYFANKDGAFSAVSSPSGTSHAFSVAAATSANIEPGSYQWQARATGGGSISVVESGWVKVLPNPASNQRRDPRSTTEITLEALECTLKGRATSDQLAMAINGRSISRIPIPELLKWRDTLKAEVAAEKRGDRAGLGRQIKVRLYRA